MANIFKFSLLLLSSLISSIDAVPTAVNTSNCTTQTETTPECCPTCFQGLPTEYTLTVVKKFDGNANLDRLYNGLKVETFEIFQSTVTSYCPFTGEQASFCPNGTDMALTGTLYPLSEVPGGQSMYVNYDGLVEITVQHSAGFPAGSYPYYQGWTWTPYPIWEPADFLCPGNNSQYNCATPTGYWDFKLPNTTVGGLAACPNEYNPLATSIYAITPGFNLSRTDCVHLDGLGTHNYTGPDPPVWAYY